MISRCVIHEIARDDLQRYAIYIGQQSRDAAHCLHAAAQQAIAKLAENPQFGTLLRKLKPKHQGIRVCRIEGFPNHLIFYRSKDETLEVLRILHGAMDWERIIGSQVE